MKAKLKATNEFQSKINHRSGVPLFSSNVSLLGQMSIKNLKTNIEDHTSEKHTGICSNNQQEKHNISKDSEQR